MDNEIQHINLLNLPKEIIDIIISFLNFSSSIKFLICCPYTCLLVNNNNNFKRYKKRLKNDPNSILIQAAIEEDKLLCDFAKTVFNNKLYPNLCLFNESVLKNNQGEKINVRYIINENIVIELYILMGKKSIKSLNKKL